MAAPVPDACPRCLMAFARHAVVPARCAKRWRGANFDAAAAEGNVGAAVAGVLGLRVRTTAELEAFLKRAVVKTFGHGAPPDPDSPIDTDEGEDFEFHVGLRADVDDATFARVLAAAREAVGKSRHFSLR